MGSTGIATGSALCSYCCQVTVIKNTPGSGNGLPWGGGGGIGEKATGSARPGFSPERLCLE